MSSKIEYKRTICFCNKRIKKKFRCEWFQLYPLDEYINSDLPTDHFPFVLEYKIITDDISQISYEAYLEEDNEKMEQIDRDFWSKMNHEYNVMIYILRLLSVVTNHHFFIYNANDKGWFINLDGKVNEDIFCKYGAKIYVDQKLKDFSFIYKFSDVDFQDIEIVQHSAYYQAPDIDDELNNELKMSEHSLLFFESLTNLTEVQKQYFDAAIVLINNGTKIRNEMKSLSFLAFISSIETMTSLVTKLNSEEIEIECHSCKSIKKSKYSCKSCGKPIWGVSQQIKIYLEKYLSADKKLKTSINKLYNYRSKIAHAGSLLTGDISFEWNDPKKREEHFHTLLTAMQYSKMSLVNYVLMNK